MSRHTSRWMAIACAAVLAFAVTPAAFAAKEFAEHKIILQLSDADPQKQQLVLNVANNLIQEYGADKVAIEVIAFGPGLPLMYADNANKGRVKSLVDSAGVQFHACSNTIKAYTNQLGYEPEINPLASKDTPAIVRIVTLVKQGYVVVKP